jgi:ABC-type multidrug transport system fused ATPase/permease subunit
LLHKAAKDANCYDFIMDVEKFPMGFKTELIEGGSNLSGG